MLFFRFSMWKIWTLKTHLIEYLTSIPFIKICMWKKDECGTQKNVSLLLKICREKFLIFSFCFEFVKNISGEIYKIVHLFEF